ncbi:hypothetical protein SGLAD_v1c04640 [Spiroplasma gladiatoris]|uniref:Uncharacterized protein n=1 Tax=Spiroplasma gladiatoris TaxID=2143 RepID=A0A4P7AIW0_9MOLU|nr:hypothetical protein [Spiroplasma gladiatoris]QBQ07663.1 hypothetical protein SGLAD_v1c04640 [Spiroplasma gladiatoris]
MIEKFKSFNINSINIEDLKNINLFWEKELNKNIKKLEKWLFKFNKTNVGFEITNDHSLNNYEKLFKEIDNYKNFFNQKYKLIITDLKLLKKFEKMIRDYCQILGLIRFIETMCNYFVLSNKLDIAKPSFFAIDLANKEILNVFEHYKNEIKTIFKTDEYLKIIWDDYIIPKSSVVAIEKNIVLTINYAKKLAKKKKITNNEYLKITVSTIETYNFLLSYKKLISIFISYLY